MNPFAVLELPERATLTTDEVKEQFVRLSAEHHPDHPGAAAGTRERFTQINQAYQLLLSPGARLKALLQQRFPDTFEIKGALPEGLLDLFSLIGPTLQEADAFLAKKSKATSALAEALLAPQLIETQEKLGQAANAVNQHLETATARLEEIDRLLDPAKANEGALNTASVLCREFLYLEKWQAQIQSRFHELF